MKIFILILTVLSNGDFTNPEFIVQSHPLITTTIEECHTLLNEQELELKEMLVGVHFGLACTEVEVK